MKSFRLTLVSVIILFMIFPFAGCTANNDRNSEISQVQILGQESRESEDTQIQKASEDVTKPNMEPNTKSEPDIIAEPDTEFEPEIPIDSDEPVAVSQLDYDSFQSRMTDKEWDGLLQYFPILKENVEFRLAGWWNDEALNVDGKIAEEGEPVIFYRYTPEEITNINAYVMKYVDDDENDIGEMLIREVRVFDLDGDGVQELILEWTPAGDYLILHREGEDFYAWEIMYRGFEMLQTNGIYIGSGGAASNSWYRMRFDNGVWMEEKLAEEDWGEFHLQGEEVDEETFRQQTDDYRAEDVTGYVPQKMPGS